MINYETFIFSNNPASATNTTSLAGRSAGECLVLQIGYDGVGSVLSTTLENAAQVNTRVSIGVWSQQIYVAILTPGDIAAGSFDVTFTLSCYSDVISSVLSGVDRQTPAGDSSKDDDTGTSNVGLSVTPTREDSMLLFFSTSAGSTRTSGPAGMTEEYVQDFNIYGDSQIVPAGPTGTRTSTYGGAQGWLNHMVIVQPPLLDNALFFGGGPL